MEDRPAGVGRIARRDRGGVSSHESRACCVALSGCGTPGRRHRPGAQLADHPLPHRGVSADVRRDRWCRTRRPRPWPTSKPGRCGNRRRSCLMTAACWVASSAAGAEARAGTWPAGAAARRNTLIHRAAIPIEDPSTARRTLRTLIAVTRLPPAIFSRPTIRISGYRPQSPNKVGARRLSAPSAPAPAVPATARPRRSGTGTASHLVYLCKGRCSARGGWPESPGPARFAVFSWPVIS